MTPSVSPHSPPPVPVYATGVHPPSSGRPMEQRTVRDQLDRAVSIAMRSLRFRWYAALVLLLGTVISLAVALLKPRMYTSETLIVYREGIGARQVLGTDQAVDAAQKLALKLKEVVLSRTRLQKIIDEFHLYPAVVDKRGYVEAVDEMRKNIGFRAKDGETFGLSYTGIDPDQAQKVTARMAQDLLEEHSRSRLEAAGDTKEFLDVKKRLSDEDLRDKESALATFIAKHPEFAREANGVNAGTDSGLAVRASAKSVKQPADPQLAALERQSQRLQERLGMPVHKKAPPDADPKLVAARNDAENELKKAQADYAEKSAEFTEEHPDVRSAKARMKAAESKLRHANDALTASTDAQKPEPIDEGAINRTALEAELKRVQDNQRLQAPPLRRLGTDAGGGLEQHRHARDRVGSPQPRGRRRARAERPAPVAPVQREHDGERGDERAQLADDHRRPGVPAHAPGQGAYPGRAHRPGRLDGARRRPRAVARAARRPPLRSHRRGRAERSAPRGGAAHRRQT